MATFFHLIIVGIGVATLATTQMHWLVSALNWGSVCGNLVLVGMWTADSLAKRK